MNFYLFSGKFANKWGISALTIFILTIAGLVPAIYNGYPLFCGDSIYYLEHAVIRAVSELHPTFYSLLLRVVTFSVSPWRWTIFQSLLSGAVVFYSFYALINRPLHVRERIMLFCLCAFTALGIESSLIMADFATGLLILIVYVYCRRQSMSWWERLWNLTAIAILASLHLTNTPITISMIGVIVLMHFLGWRASLWNCGHVLAIIFLILTAISIQNTIVYGSGKIARLSGRYFFARFFTDGLLDPYLEKNCQNLDFKICRVFPSIQRDPVWILWNRESPLAYTGEGWQEAESSAVVYSAFLQDPAPFVRQVLKSGWKQLFDIGPWETMGVEGPFSNWLAETRAIALSQADNEALGAGMQMNNQLPVTTINSYLNKLYLGSIIGLFIALPFLSSARGLILYVLISLYVQACFTGGLSIVTGRYQLRVSWLPVFCLMFVLAKLISSPALSDRDYETNG